jgi:hypothetical protein
MVELTSRYVLAVFDMTVASITSDHLCQWTLNWTNIGWTFRSRATGLYIGLDGSPADGTRLVAVTTPVGWDIWHDEVNPSTYRYVCPIFLKHRTYLHPGFLSTELISTLTYMDTEIPPLLLLLRCGILGVALTRLGSST